MSGNGTHNPKHNSIPLTEGPSRAGARAMLHGVGFSREDLAKPIIGIANTWTEIGPCNFHLRILADAVKQGVRDAGGTPMEFNTVTISDGITMGTEGMRASLVSREVIADSIELVARGNLFDGLIAIAGCDKNMPAAVMALARLDIPSLMLYGGSIAPGHFRDREVTVQDVFEGIGAHARGTLDDAGLAELEAAACPGAGACGGQFTGQYHGHGLRISRHLAHGPLRCPRALHREDQVRTRSRTARHATREKQSAAQPDHHPGGARQCDRQRGRFRRFDQCRAAPARHCT